MCITLTAWVTMEVSKSECAFKKQSHRLPAGKANRKVSYLVQNLCPWSTCACESNNDCCIPCRCFHVITVTSDGPWTQHQGPRGHIPCILVGTTQASQECGRFWENLDIRLIEYRWPRIICRHFLSPSITQWSIFMVSTGLFQAFRWAENGTSGEQRENNKRAGIDKKSSMSTTRWRLYFHCQCIRPTQLIDRQLIKYFFFILRLHNSFFVTWSCRSMTCYESSATHVFRITDFWIIGNVTF